MSTGAPPESMTSGDDEETPTEPFSMVELPDPTAEEMLGLYTIYREMGGDPLDAIELLRRQAEAA